MPRCLVCGKEYNANEEFVRAHGGSFARKMVCSWECFNISVKAGGERMNRQYEDMQMNRFKPLEVT